MASKSPNYTFISRDDSEEDTENLSEELIPNWNHRQDYVEIARFDDFDPWILWLSSHD